MKYFEVKFNIQPANRDAADLLASLAGDAGLESFDDNGDGLRGYAQCGMLDENVLKSVIANFPIKDIDIRYSISNAEDRDWNEEWERNGFEPIYIGDRCVVHDTRHNVSPSVPIDITIDAKLAFGTGTHETTRMITEVLLSGDLGGCNVLDCGCGTGILSFVAAKCGAERVTGYDIDEWSVENAMHNAVINGVRDFKAYCGDCTLLSDCAELIDRGPFDVVIANINRNILTHDMPWFRMVMKKNSQLILSGFYNGDEHVVTAKAHECGLKRIKMKEDNEWCCCVYQSESSS